MTSQAGNSNAGNSNAGQSNHDVVIIGGGIAGVTAAYDLAETHNVVLLEQEAELAHHTTSRSAALYLENEGGPINHRLSTASRSFLEDPPEDVDAPLMTPRGSINVGPVSMSDALREQARIGAEITPTIRFLQGSELTDICPVLRPDRAEVGVYEPLAMTVDVMALHQLFLRGARRRGAAVQRSARVEGLTRSGDVWVAKTAGGTFAAPVIVNAAGAWGDVVGAMAGAAPIGLTPRRRTAFTTTITHDPNPWPFIYGSDADANCYFKPEAGNQLLCSLADETPSEPCDAKPREIDIALAIDRINALTTLDIRSVNTTWAGLRTFAPDRHPVLGWDDQVDGFCWMVGQGGCGIVTSPAAGRAIGSIVRSTDLHPEMVDLGLTKQQLGPRRIG